MVRKFNSMQKNKKPWELLRKYRKEKFSTLKLFCEEFQSVTGESMLEATLANYELNHSRPSSRRLGLITKTLGLSRVKRERLESGFLNLRYVSQYTKRQKGERKVSQKPTFFEIFLENTKKLKKILAEEGWPTNFETESSLYKMALEKTFAIRYPVNPIFEHAKTGY